MPLLPQPQRRPQPAPQRDERPPRRERPRKGGKQLMAFGLGLAVGSVALMVATSLVEA